ncbi:MULTISPECIES: XisI protein [Leptolyngbya]|uniref:XisI protein n=1 Tax=Leptolyngbya TaxID=47251 RepID=UPI001683D757|nr:XisI protein [Leptolyngbya sp. FACHB-1624]MBD1855484.1 XisI protein [Leptolyngbya sp. FACHB-1624]
MDTLTRYQDTIEQILKDYAAVPYSYGDINQSVIIDAARTHFLLFTEGWKGNKRVHGAIIHVEIRDGKIWIHYDGTEDGITNELLAAGVPKDHIVLAFHPPQVRPHTGYAVA